MRRGATATAVTATNAVGTINRRSVGTTFIHSMRQEAATTVMNMYALYASRCSGNVGLC